MSNEIGYGAAAIKAGEVKYQQSLVDLLKQAAQKPEQTDAKSATAAKYADAQVGQHLDVKA